MASDPTPLMQHAANILALREWHLRRWPGLRWQNLEGSREAGDTYLAVLIGYVRDLYQRFIINVKHMSTDDMTAEISLSHSRPVSRRR